jgi:hypothetical protein
LCLLYRLSSGFSDLAVQPWLGPCDGVFCLHNKP